MKLNFSTTELLDLAKAWIALSLAFGILLAGGILKSSIMGTFLLSLITVGLAFIVHELGHKFVAQHYKLHAEFRSDDKMLLLAVFMSFFGFVFAAPGAVMISGRMNVKQYGIISLAGPAMNIVMALTIYILSITLSLSPTGIVGAVVTYGIMINSWLALFNMIPLGNFDGRKIWRWSKFAYGVTVAVALALVVLL